MTEAVIVALITGACAVVGQLILSRSNNKELYAKLDKQSEVSDAKLEARIAVIDAKMEDLTREVRTHNDFARRVPAMEEQLRGVSYSVF